MSTVYLNGEFKPQELATISPMDRGFLFADAVYEVIPSYAGKLVGFELHIERLQQGLNALEIALPMTRDNWRELITELLNRNGLGNKGVYIQVSRGAQLTRAHAYPADYQPTVFMFTLDIPPAPEANPLTAKSYSVVSEQDKRWRRCHIKSTSLLGNIMHYRTGQTQGNDEVLLFNDAGELTEAAACNVFVIKAGRVATPPLDNQILPGITRHILLQALANYSDIEVEERTITREEVQQADEIWLTSSTKEVGAVVNFDGRPVGAGRIGPIWQQAQSLFSQHKYQF